MSTGGVSPAGLAFKMANQLSPIVLTGGIATNVPGGVLPIIALTEGVNFLDSILGGSQDLGLDDFFANFTPLPGSTLLNLQLAKYPFANQSIAANAVIQQPLQISLMMLCPVRDEAGYPLKLATMIALQKSLQQHAILGGTYSVITPSYIYTSCILTALRDASGGETKQAQYAYQWDFEQPLITLQAAQSAQNGLMSAISGGLPTSSTPSWSNYFALPVNNPLQLFTGGQQP